MTVEAAVCPECGGSHSSIAPEFGLCLTCHTTTAKPLGLSNGAVPPVPLSSGRATVQRYRELAFEACRELAGEERILDRLRALLPEVGLVGEDRNALLTREITVCGPSDTPHPLCPVTRPQ